MIGTYAPMEFVEMLFELDALVKGDFSEKVFVGSDVRQALYFTVRGMCRVWKFPSIEQLLTPKVSPSPLEIMIEARRALEVIYNRRRGYLCGISDEFIASQKICGMLLPHRLEIDRMIVDALGIKGRRASENDVVRAGGYDRELLNITLISNL